LIGRPVHAAGASKPQSQEIMFGTLGGPEIVLILVLALIIFGPRKLPEIGKSMGRMMGEFRKASNDFKRTIEDEIEAEKRPAEPPARLEPPPVDEDPYATAAAPPAPELQVLPPEGEVVSRASGDTPAPAPEVPPESTSGGPDLTK
jgi:TatA/E family protein of Tat protein translocase